MTGIWTSQATLTPVFGNRVLPTTYYFKLNPGVNPTTTAKTLQNAFMANGLQADSMQKLLNEQIGGSVVMDHLIEGFLALGLVIGVAALGVVTARAVVERRQLGSPGRSRSWRSTSRPRPSHSSRAIVSSRPALAGGHGSS